MNRQQKRSNGRKIGKAIITGDKQTINTVIALLDPAITVHGMDIGSVQRETGSGRAEIKLSENDQKLAKLYSTFATTIWRMRNRIIDPETGEPKQELKERSVSMLARDLSRIDDVLKDAGVEIKADYDGKTHDEGNAVNVISYEDRPGIDHDIYVETLRPTVRWTNEEGTTLILQKAEVVVGRPAAAASVGK